MPEQKSKAILNDIGTEECVPQCYIFLKKFIKNEKKRIDLE